MKIDFFSHFTEYIYTRTQIYMQYISFPHTSHHTCTHLHCLYLRLLKVGQSCIVVVCFSLEATKNRKEIKKKGEYKKKKKQRNSK